MSMVPTSNAFKDNATGALKDAPLQEALGIAEFIPSRRASIPSPRCGIQSNCATSAVT